MPVTRLTKRTVDALPYPDTGQELYRDQLLPGFGLRVGTRSKVFFAEGQVHRRTVRVTIGRADLLSPEIARRKAMAVLGEMAGGANPNQAKRVSIKTAITVETAFAEFFKAKPHLAEFTVGSYGRTQRLYLADWARRPLRDITRQMVLKKHQQVAKDRGAVTANNVMRHLRSVFNWVSATQEDFPPNPVAILTQARAWNKERRRRTLIAVHNLPAWWQAVMAEPEHARDYLLIALLTGMRRSEIATLKWDHVDLVGRAFHLPKTKNGDPLDLPMSNFVAGLIEARRELVGQTEWVFPGTGKTGHPVETKSFTRRVRCPRIAGELYRVFPGPGRIQAWPQPRLPGGGALLYENFRKRCWRPIFARLCLPYVTPHSARHLFISALQMAGIEVGLVAKLAGHSNPTVTLGHYTQAVRGGEDAIKLLEQTFIAAGGLDRASNGA